jgi:acyl-CoA thioester hydrolase
MNDTDASSPRSGRPRVPERAQFRFWCEEKLRNADTDQFHHVNNAAMATFFEAGRMEIFAADDVRGAMDGGNVAVVRLLIEFHRELFHPGKVAIGSAIASIGTSSLGIRQALFDASGCVASAEATCVLLSPTTRRAQKISDALRACLAAASQRAG